MDKKERVAKKERIQKHIDLARGRFNDEELNTLDNLVTNRDNYNGKSHTIKRSSNGSSSNGKYREDTTITSTFKNDESGIHIDVSCKSKYDDGEYSESNFIYKTGREILNYIKNSRNT